MSRPIRALLLSLPSERPNSDAPVGLAAFGSNASMPESRMFNSLVIYGEIIPEFLTVQLVQMWGAETMIRTVTFHLEKYQAQPADFELELA
jgi:hypothetical protein